MVLLVMSLACEMLLTAAHITTAVTGDDDDYDASIQAINVPDMVFLIGSLCCTVCTFCANLLGMHAMIRLLMGLATRLRNTITNTGRQVRKNPFLHGIALLPACVRASRACLLPCEFKAAANA